MALRPNSNTPLKLSAKTSITTARQKTNAGDCSWNPQPSCAPPARSTASTPASAQNDTSTPSVNATPCSVTLRRSLPDWFTKPTILMPSTGNTQGIRLRIRPPNSADTSVANSLPIAVPEEDPLALVVGPAAAAPGAVALDPNGTSICSPRYTPFLSV